MTAHLSKDRAAVFTQPPKGKSNGLPFFFALRKEIETCGFLFRRAGFC
jgi:hypothetical protein